LNPTAEKSWTIGSILNWTQQYFSRCDLPQARLDAELIIAHSLGLKRVDLYVQHDMPVRLEERAIIRELVKARADDRVPVAYLLGRKEFYGLSFQVDSNVLIPRPETEALVDVCIEKLKTFESPTEQTIRMLDIGTGSGAIAIAVAKHIEDVEILAADISPEALEIAARNAEEHGVVDRIEFVIADMFTDPPDLGTFQVVVSNPPYIDPSEKGELAPEIQKHEPALALFAPSAGEACIEALMTNTKHLVHDGGFLAFEVQPPVRARAWADRVSTQNGFTDAQPVFDISGEARGVVARFHRESPEG